MAKKAEKSKKKKNWLRCPKGPAVNPRGTIALNQRFLNFFHSQHHFEREIYRDPILYRNRYGMNQGCPTFKLSWAKF